MPRITWEAARVNTGMSQEKMAEKMGVSRALYNRMETGKVEIKPVYLYAFCLITGFSTDDIIMPSESTKRSNKE